MANKRHPVVLRRRSDFLNILKNGRRVHPSSWLVLNYKANEFGFVRCGWTLPRAVGSAVVRNRLKRWSREYFRNSLHENETVAVDVNIVFRRADGDFYKKLKYDEFARTLERGWKAVRKRL